MFCKELFINKYSHVGADIIWAGVLSKLCKRWEVNWFYTLNLKAKITQFVNKPCSRE